MTPPNLCIYHANCADGFAAAWVVRKFFTERDQLKEIEFFPGIYQNPPPAPLKERDVYLVDFSYKPNVLAQMAEYANRIIIIDHHKSAIEDISAAFVAGTLPKNIETHFSNDFSGCMLTWKYFYGTQEPPKLLRHIEDRDLWRFALPKTREIQAAVFSYPYDFSVWDNLMDSIRIDGDHAYDEEQYLEILADQGEAIERKHFKDIGELLDVVTRWMVIDGLQVRVANLPYIHSSDAGHALALQDKNGFGACYWDTPQGRVFSLRSTEDGVDVSEIAKKFGGGGHKHAAGFKVSFSEARKFEMVKQ